MTKDLLKIEIIVFNFILVCFASYTTIFVSTLTGGTIVNDDRKGQ